jgi:beta-phosphoglucomutase-like phosphatase (HAD superfamily)
MALATPHASISHVCSLPCNANSRVRQATLLRNVRPVATLRANAASCNTCGCIGRCSCTFPTSSQRLSARSSVGGSVHAMQLSAKPHRATAARGVARVVAASNTKNPKIAILFDCDGVIVETEELHRLAYNKSFVDSGLQIQGVQMDWAVSYYDVLQNTVGGGKPKMKWHFAQNEWPTYMNDGIRMPAPSTTEEQDALVDHLQDRKTDFYKVIVEEVATARPGVLALMDEGLANPDIALGICSAATRAGFEKVVNSVVGPERLAKFDIIIAGDDVDKKKPHPMIYNLAQERLGLSGDKCVVIEDSMVGLRAAVSAGCHCLITYTESTKTADFKGEGAKVAVADIGGYTVDSLAAQIWEDWPVSVKA